MTRPNGLEWTRDGASCLHFNALGPAPLRPSVRHELASTRMGYSIGYVAFQNKTREEVLALTEVADTGEVDEANERKPKKVRRTL